MGVNCQLMKDGSVLEEEEISLEANGQDARFIEQMFTNADTSDFVGSVRCTAPGPFTGVAVELDAGNRIFTTLPVVPVDRTEGINKEAFLDFAHFANGTGITSSLVFVNESAPQRAGSFTLAGQLVRPALYFYDKEGNPIAAESVVDVMGDLEVTEDGTLTVRKELAAIIHKFGVSVDFLRKFRAESVFRCDYKASKLVEPNRDEARAPSGNSSARRGLYICVGAGSQGTVRWDTDGASVMRRAFVRDKTMPGAPRCDEKFPEPGHRF